MKHDKEIIRSLEDIEAIVNKEFPLIKQRITALEDNILSLSGNMQVVLNNAKVQTATLDKITLDLEVVKNALGK